MVKAEGLKNRSDLCTKHLTVERIDAYSDLIGYAYDEERAKSTVPLNFIRSNWTRWLEVSDGRVDRAVAPSEGELLREAKSWFRVLPIH